MMGQMALQGVDLGRTVWPLLTAAVLLTAAGCKSPGQPSPAPGPTAPPPNTAPQVQSVQTSVMTRTEVDTDVTLTVNVTDAESNVETLTYQWSAAVGTISGSGRTVTWRLPKGTAMTPQDVTVNVAVLEPYQVLQGGVIVNRQHRVDAAATPFRVHDSVAEVTAVSLKFLQLFVDNTVSPAMCVADFSDSCSGKADELEDVARIRRARSIQGSTLEPQATSVNGTFTAGTATIDCRFESLVIEKVDASDPFSPGDSVFAEGECVLEAIYEAGQWLLCSSRFFGSAEMPLPALPGVAWDGRRPGLTIAGAVLRGTGR